MCVNPSSLRIRLSDVRDRVARVRVTASVISPENRVVDQSISGLGVGRTVLRALVPSAVECAGVVRICCSRAVGFFNGRFIVVSDYVRM